jgi:hypothetical protein
MDQFIKKAESQVHNKFILFCKRVSHAYSHSRTNARAALQLEIGFRNQTSNS